MGQAKVKYGSLSRTEYIERAKAAEAAKLRESVLAECARLELINQQYQLAVSMLSESELEQSIERYREFKAKESRRHVAMAELMGIFYGSMLSAGYIGRL